MRSEDLKDRTEQEKSFEIPENEKIFLKMSMNDTSPATKQIQQF